MYPVRFCLKNTGPGDESLMAIATGMNMMGEKINAIEEKQVAQQKLLTAETEKQTAITKAEAEAETLKIKAEAEAHANEVLADSLNAMGDAPVELYREFMKFYLNLKG